MSPLEDLLDTEGEDGFDLDRYSAIDAPLHDHLDVLSKMDIQSMTTSQYDALIENELERKWILNLSMHFRDKSKREKFFVTFRQHEHHWRRVTISLDYRNAPENSLEAELSRTEYQRDKSAKIYDAVRDSLAEIDFYSTVTNLKLETKDGRLHVHVVEDVNVCCWDRPIAPRPADPCKGSHQLPPNPHDPAHELQKRQGARDSL
jgi:hypothetical protein